MARKLKVNIKVLLQGKKYIEAITYSLILAVIGYMQYRLYIDAIKPYRDLILVAYGIELINIILAIAVVKRMRLLAHLLLVTAIICGFITLYYLKVTITSNLLY